MGKNSRQQTVDSSQQSAVSCQQSAVSNQQSAISNQYPHLLVCRDRALALSKADRPEGLSLLNKRGFALISMIIILSLLGIATGVATSFAHRLKTSRRQVATEDELKALREAILGNPREYSTQGRNNFGYLGDMGGLPAALSDLYTKGTQPNYAWGTAGQGAGWAGPYITPILREDLGDLLEDPYGNTYNYTTTAYQRASDNEWVSARIHSFGPNKRDDGGAGDDRQVEILQRETRSTVSGYVVDSTGTGINGATVDLYRPVAGSVSTPIPATTNTSGLYTFPAGVPNGTDVPYGIRTITATTPAAGNLQYAPNSALAAPEDNDLSFNITNWGAAAVPVTSIRLDYTFTPTGYYKYVWIGCPDGYNCTTTCPPGGYICLDGLCQIFDHNNDALNDALNDTTNPRAPTGTTLTFPDTTISGGSMSSTTRILVASDSVQPPNIVLSPRGGTLNIRYLEFMRNPTGGGPSVDVDGETFTVTLNNGATVVLTATFTAHEEED